MKMLTDTLVDTPYKTQDPQSVGNTVLKDLLAIFICIFQVSKTCENFIKLCSRGYYDNTSKFNM